MYSMLLNNVMKYMFMFIDACDQPMDVGPCKKVTQRWFFSKSENTCKAFIFGGCKGNNNNFENEKECTQRCMFSQPKG